MCTILLSGRQPEHDARALNIRAWRLNLRQEPSEPVRHRDPLGNGIARAAPRVRQLVGAAPHLHLGSDPFEPDLLVNLRSRAPQRATR
eukprot:7386424-Prymnesium_polylepis.2